MRDWGTITKVEAVIYIILALVGLILIDTHLRDDETYVKYDCRMAEISPDMPLEVKQMCRSRR